jgi:signal transduction histidine kinase
MVIWLRRALLAIFAGWVAAWLAFPSGGSWRTAAIDVLWLVVAALAGALCLAAAAVPANARLRRSLIALAAGSFAWGGGQAIWTYYELLADRPSPYPSLADAGYLACTPLLALALVYWPYDGGRRPRARVAEAALAAGAASLAAFVFLIGPALDADSSGWAKVLDILYPISEFGTAAIVAGAVLLEGWIERQRLFLMLAGLVALGLADGLYGFVDYSTGNPIDIGWTLAFVLVGLAAAPPQLADRWCNARFPTWAWAAMVVILLSGVAVDHFQKDLGRLGWADAVETGGILVLFLALIARFLVVLREAERQTEAVASAHAKLAVQQAQEREHRDRFMGEIVAAREDEARRVAGLLHDDAVQRLTALALRLELAERRAPAADIGSLAQEARDITRSMRQLMTELHPAVLESQGLAAAIEVVAEPLRQQGVRVFVDAPARRAPADVERVAYRVAHEALVNTLKHADATEAVVSIRLEAGLRCEIRDNGCGFDTASVESALSRGSLGLHLVRERIERAGGRLLIHSSPGAGTSILFDLPIAVSATVPREAVSA